MPCRQAYGVSSCCMRMTAACKHGLAPCEVMPEDECRLWRRAIRLDKMRHSRSHLEKRAFLLMPATQVNRAC